MFGVLSFPWNTAVRVCRWASCNETVNKDFDTDFLIKYDLLLPSMLGMADGIRVLIYVGMEVSTYSNAHRSRSDSAVPILLRFLACRTPN